MDSIDELENSNSFEGTNLETNNNVQKEENIEDDIGEDIEEKVVKSDNMDEIQLRKEKTRLILSISRYKTQFAKYLMAYDEILSLSHLRTLSLQELENILQEVMIAVSCRSSSSLVENMYFQTIKTAESFAPMINMDIKGLNEDLKENEQIKETLQEISLKYENIAYVDPISRLGFLTLTSLYSKHKMNSLSKKLNNFDSTKISTDIKDKYQDL